MTTSIQPSLYALTDAYLAVIDKLESGESTREDVAAELQGIVGDIRSKAEAIACVHADMERRAEACKQEAKRLAERARIAEAHSEWLRKYVLDQMKAIGLDRLETPRFTLAIRTNPPAVTVVNAAAVPAEFNKTTITTTVNKTAVLAAVKATGEIPAGIEITRSERVSIQ